MKVWVWVMHLVSGPSPWKQPLPVYISSPAPSEGSHTGPFCFNTERPFMSPASVYLPSPPILPPQTGPPAATHTLKHTMTADQYIIHVAVTLSWWVTPVGITASPLFGFFFTSFPSFFFPLIFHHLPLFNFLKHTVFIFLHYTWCHFPFVQFPLSAVTSSFAVQQFSGHWDLL